MNRLPGKRQKGVAAIEFAILVPMMLLMVFGITEFGRAFYQYNTLVKSVRNGVRYLSTQGTGMGADRAKCLAVHGNQNCTGPVLLPNLTLDMASVTYGTASYGGGTLNLATLTITGYPFVSSVNFSFGALTIGAPDMTFGPIGATMRQV